MFIIQQKGRNWVLTLDLLADPNQTASLEKILVKIVEELKDNPNARRMSYDTWYWRDRTIMNTWITYFNLKYLK